jgi:hypothetical protein
MAITTGISWREEMRQDRLARAQADRDRETARTQARIAERESLARIRREDEAARAENRHDRRARRAEARARARQSRAEGRARLSAWVSGHVTDLLFVPVIVIPGVLAWTAMADFGEHLYGTPGLGLPAVSEGSMWAFAAATTLTRRNHPGRPVWHLRLGTAVFAGVGAAMNFAHGMAVTWGGVWTGTLMAIVSVSGVTAHQLVTAGPRRSRADRAAARLERAARRRETRARRAAIRCARAELDDGGNARLVYQPGLAQMGRRHGRTRLSLTPAPATGRNEPHRTGGEPAAITAARTSDRTDRPALAAERIRMEPSRAPHTRTDRTSRTAPQAPDKDAMVAEIIADILAAAETGERWKPDYDDMMTRTGLSLSWCEKRVGEARRSVFGPSPARTGRADSPQAASAPAGTPPSDVQHARTANPHEPGEPDGQPRTNRTASRTTEPAGALS